MHPEAVAALLQVIRDDIQEIKEEFVRRSEVRAEISSHQRICPAVHDNKRIYRQFTVIAGTCAGVGTILGIVISMLS